MKGWRITQAIISKPIKSSYNHPRAGQAEYVEFYVDDTFKGKGTYCIDMGALQS